DRRLPRERRLAEQRERLMAATTLAVAHEAAPSVASIVRRAGVGRNTFYEYFDDVERAVEATRVTVLRRIDEALRRAESSARTPVERWRSLAHAWLDFADSDPGAMLIALRVDGPASGASGTAVLEAAFERSLETLRSAGVASPPASADRVLAVAAVGEAFGRGLARTQISVSDEPSPGVSRAVSRSFERERLERSLVEVAVRLLR
ncbi:MAG TPA: hypothetical protein VF103_14435, partial [Polyangiaceae bacterium]